VAQYFGTRHHQIIVRSSDFPALLREVVLHLDQPLGDPAAFALYCLSSLTRERVTVALSGDGADEIFVGYPTYHANRYLQWYRRIPRVLREHIVESLAHRLPTSTDKFSFDFRVKKFLEGAGLSSRKAHYSWRTIYTDEEKHSIFAPSVREHIRADSYAVYERHFEEAGDIDFTSQCLYADLRVWLAGNNLHKVDSMTMAHSLEARVPYLDQVLVEFMMRVPPDLKFKGHQSKYLLKKAMRGLLPEDVLRRRKAGWHIPLAGWFCHDLRSFLQDRFDNAPREFYKVFDRAEVQRILQEHIQKKRNHSFKLWGLLVLNEWFRVYNPCVELGVYRSVG
jgi:asparagine synthase (glutamine-hydrolysing)